MADYIELEREVSVQKGRDSGLYESDYWLRGRRHTSELLKVGGESRRIAELSANERQRLLLPGPDGDYEPAAVWLTAKGRPTHRDAWRSAFQRASQRCLMFDLELVASPHTLRHTFAIYMLRSFVRLQIADEENSPPADSVAYRQLAFDPLRKVQTLMGHSSLETTMIYLDVLPEVEELIPRGMGVLAEELGLG